MKAKHPGYGKNEGGIAIPLRRRQGCAAVRTQKALAAVSNPCLLSARGRPLLTRRDKRMTGMKNKPSKKQGKLIREVDERSEPRVATALFNAVRKLRAIRFRKILATTDFSQAAMEGVGVAGWFAQRFSASVLLAHVVEPPPLFSGMDEVVLARETHEVVKSAETQLKRLAKREMQSKSNVQMSVREGKAFDEIAKLAGERDIDLIVIATRGHTGLKRVWLGSTAERVVRHAPCPVLTVPARNAVSGRGGVRQVPLKRIVVPIDCSETSVHALPYAEAIADEFGAEVILLHVMEPFGAEEQSKHIYDDAAEGEYEAAAEACLTRLSQESLTRDRRIRTAVRRGVPYQEITRAATAISADLIVLTTRGYTGLKHVLLGSTAERVVRHADCPVLVVREKTPAGRGKRRK
jgi:nucleotide-binding universal stress UspA family protein